MSKPTISSKLYLVAKLMDEFVQSENASLHKDVMDLVGRYDIVKDELDSMRDINNELRNENTAVLIDLHGAGNSIAMLRSYSERLETQLRADRRQCRELMNELRITRERVAEVEDHYRDAEDRNHRLIMRNRVLEEYILDCTCRESPAPDTVSYEVVVDDEDYPLNSREDDSEMTETDEELPAMPQQE